MSNPWILNTQRWYNNTYAGRPGLYRITEDGISGWQTMYALTRALQCELGLTQYADNFGPATLAALTAFGTITATHPDPATPSNIVKIAQGGLYCKGYNAGNGRLTGRWGSAFPGKLSLTQIAMASLRDDLGLGRSSSDLEPKLFKFLLNMSSATLAPGGNRTIRDAQHALNARYLSRQDFFAVPADGLLSRDTLTGLIFALQYDAGMQDGVANGYFGPQTRSLLQKYGNLEVGSSDTKQGSYFVHWFSAALQINGYDTTFTGTFTKAMSEDVADLQRFVKLPVTGKVDMATWGSALVSFGDPDRPGTGADGITTLTDERLATLKGAGYTHFGRYLTNTPDDVPDKCLKWGEMERILDAQGRVFPIFQTAAGIPGHFTYERGKQVAEEGFNAAWAYRIPAGSIIYFTVDYDVQDWEITQRIIPYFTGIKEMVGPALGLYKIGVYGPRSVCARLASLGLTVSSFPADMSSGYSGNIGQKLPANWAFDQIQNLTIGTGDAAIEIDKNVVSGNDAGVSELAPPIGVGNDPLIPESSFSAFEDAWFETCLRYAAPDQVQTMKENRSDTRKVIQENDPLITSLVSNFSVYKSFVMTPLIWATITKTTPNGTGDDPWPAAGICALTPRTAILARAFAVQQGLISEPVLNPDSPDDLSYMSKKLASDDAYSIETAMLAMMMYANTMANVSPSQLRSLTPSQVIRMCYGYTGDMVQGRNRTQLYYLIQRWHESFRRH